MQCSTTFVSFKRGKRIFDVHRRSYTHTTHTLARAQPCFHALSVSYVVAAICFIFQITSQPLGMSYFLYPMCLLEYNILATILYGVALHMTMLFITLI